MAEHEPHRACFDEQALADALNTRSATVRDVAYGEGVQYSTRRGSVRLEIFPRPGVTRLTAPDVRLELFGGARIEVSDGGVEFSRTQSGQDASLTVVPDGGIVFTLVAGGEHRAPEGAAPQSAEPLPQPASGHETAPGRAPDRPQPAAEHEASPEPEAVTMQGRLGRDPWFGGSEDSPIAGFPLAINAANRTIWHKVVVFDEAAAKLAAQLHRGDVRKGRLVEVTGQLVVREDPTLNAEERSGGRPQDPQGLGSAATGAADLLTGRSLAPLSPSPTGLFSFQLLCRPPAGRSASRQGLPGYRPDPVRLPVRVRMLFVQVL